MAVEAVFQKLMRGSGIINAILLIVIVSFVLIGLRQSYQIEGLQAQIQNNMEAINGLKNELSRERSRADFWEQQRYKEVLLLEELSVKILASKEEHEGRMEKLEALEAQDDESAAWLDLPVPAAIRELFGLSARDSD